MAKPEHLDKLKEGVESWNMWRHNNPEIVPALWRADLEEANLRGAKLRGADLRGANLWGADFDRTDLKRADLEGANLRAAIYLRAKQLCETKTLYQTELDPDLEREARRERPFLFEKPRGKA